MPNPQGIWSFIQQQSTQGLKVILLQVLESQGSSPGRQGFRMAVDETGQMHGSIGGGIMEHKFVEMAKVRLLEEVEERSVHRQIHDKTAPKNQSGMICSGEQTVLLYTIQENDREAIDNVIEAVSNRQPGTIRLSPNGIDFDKDEFSEMFSYSFQSENEWLYREKIGFQNNLFIVGGGHCALAFSKVMAMMDFHIHLFEDRENLNTVQQNAFVHEKTIVSSYEEIHDLIPADPSSYVVVMTFGYRSDDLVVRSLRGKEFGFFGVLGSKKKIEKMWADYRAEGFDEKWLKSISAPVGIPIKSQTPEEIAISIAAEIIQVKNRQLSGTTRSSEKCC